MCGLILGFASLHPRLYADGALRALVVTREPAEWAIVLANNLRRQGCYARYMPDSYTNLLYHLVFSTKDRRPLITPDYEVRLYDYIGGTVRKLGGISLALNGTVDHVHLLAKLRPDRALSDVLRALKASATGWMHDVFPALNFAGSVGTVRSPLVNHTSNQYGDTFQGKKSIMRRFHFATSSLNSSR
jgi:REP element-mobilizing transposase RayT